MEFKAWYKLRRFIYDNLHNEEHESILSRVINIFLIILIIGNTAAVLLESINDLYQSYQLLFDAFELFSIFIFTLEYLLRFWAIAEKDPFEGAWKNRWLWIRSGGAIIDLLAILPAYINFFVHLDLRFLRILRLFRLLKLTRYFVSLQILLRVIKREKGSFQAVIFILLIMIIIAAAGVYVVENKAHPCIHVVGSGDTDHGRLWRCDTNHPLRPLSRGFNYYFRGGSGSASCGYSGKWSGQ